MFNLPEGSTQAFLREIHPELERDYIDGSDEHETVTCPYCGGRGDQKWFEEHTHENPFGDDQQ